jgi:hypothetical protein
MGQAINIMLLMINNTLKQREHDGLRVITSRYKFITVVSNNFYSVKILLFSSARSRDFDGMFGTGLPVSMYMTKTPIDMCGFNIRPST